MLEKQIAELEKELDRAHDKNDFTIEWVEYVHGLIMMIDELKWKLFTQKKEM